MKSFKDAPLIALEEIESTNTYLLDLLKQTGVEEGTIISAGFQTAGRGLGRNTWLSERGKNAIFSIVLFPDFLKIEDQFLITQAVSLGILNWTRSALPQKQIVIKWPNDILVEKKKICGILAQSSIQGSKLQFVVAGIGINVNQNDFGELNSIATSVYNESSGMNNINRVIQEIRNEIFEQYELLINEKHHLIQEKYLKELYLLNEKHDFISDGECFEGMILGVNHFGQLLIEDSSGKIRTFNTKEVVY